MTTLTNSFEGGTSGTTISTGNSGGASGNAFDAVPVGSGCTMAYDSTRAAHGLLSAKVATGATATTSLAEWTTSLGTQVTVYFRAYLYFTANPSAGVRAVEFRSGATHAASVLVSSSGNGVLQLSIGSGFSIVTTFTSAIPLNQWFRVEGYITGDPAAGAISCSQYDSMDSVTPTESHTATGLDTTGSLTQYWFGQGASNANQGPSWMDDIGVSTSGYLGPWTPPASSGASAGIVAPLVASGTI